MSKYVRMKYPCRIGNELILKDERVRLATKEEIEKHYPGYLREDNLSNSCMQVLVKFDHLSCFTFLSASQIYWNPDDERM